MDQINILLPMMALIMWTLLVLLIVPYRRFKAVAGKKVTIDDFKTGESANVPAEVSVPNRVYINLLEGPVLFYALVIIHYVTQSADVLAVFLAWSYFAIRVLHSLIYLTFNAVAYRLAAFVISNVILTVLWINGFIALV